jgi:hypothetical protein
MIAKGKVKLSDWYKIRLKPRISQVRNVPNPFKREREDKTTDRIIVGCLK